MPISQTLQAHETDYTLGISTKTLMAALDKLYDIPALDGGNLPTRLGRCIVVFPTHAVLSGEAIKMVLMYPSPHNTQALAY